jgi:cell division cycle 14
MPFFKNYRDASKGNCDYQCTLLHCLQGLEHAIALKWYDFATFNVREYEKIEKVENGDLNWIIPGKFVAFMGPVDNTYKTEKNYPAQRFGHHPNLHVRIFNEIGVDRVIRLNEPRYDKNVFTKAGIHHNDLEFTDGSTPP